jgi:SAM-dependent methyltransferase
MDAKELNAFYTEEYRHVYQGDSGPTQKDLRTQAGRAESLCSFVARQVPVVERHLDIGCSAGILLEKFVQHYQCLPVGVEPGDAYRAYAKNKGLRVYASLHDLKAAGGGDFDLISMAHVLEHIPDPLATLVDLRKNYLRSSGYLLVEVPNLFCHDSFEIAHMSSFSTHTLIQLMHQAGFELVASRRHGAPRSDRLPLYVTILAKAQASQVLRPVQPEKMVGLKRKLGLLYRRIYQRILPGRAWNPLP